MRRIKDNVGSSEAETKKKAHDAKLTGGPTQPNILWAEKLFQHWAMMAVAAQTRRISIFLARGGVRRASPRRRAETGSEGLPRPRLGVATACLAMRAYSKNVGASLGLGTCQ